MWNNPLMVLFLALAQDPNPPQEKPPTDPTPTQEDEDARIEEILKRYSGLKGLEGAPSLLPTESAAPEERAMLLYRASDAVEVEREGVIRSLQYWDAHLALQRGDEVRQGSKARTVLDYPEGTSVFLLGPARMRILSELDETPIQLDLPVMNQTMILHLTDTKTRVSLPGGNQIEGQSCRVTVLNVDLQTLEIRNSGPEPLEVRGPYLGSAPLMLERGKRVYLPVPPAVGVGPASIAEPSGTASTTFQTSGGPVRVELSSEVSLESSEAGLTLRSAGPTAGVARVAGARLVLRPGSTLRLGRSPLGPLRAKEN